MAEKSSSGGLKELLIGKVRSLRSASVAPFSNESVAVGDDKVFKAACQEYGFDTSTPLSSTSHGFQEGYTRYRYGGGVNDVYLEIVKDRSGREVERQIIKLGGSTNEAYRAEVAK